MLPLIKTIDHKLLAGKRKIVSHSNNKTEELWSEFIFNYKNVLNINANKDLYSISLYPDNFFISYNPNTNFEKWAAFEVLSNKDIPPQFDSLEIQPGLYAEFIYYGHHSLSFKFFESIFKEWFPKSIYTVDNRPHFEIMGKKYDNNSSNSEETIFIPIKLKQ